MLNPYNKMLPPYRKILEGKVDTTICQASQITDPVAIGAVGGSGTRVMEKLITAAGLVPASPLNAAGDAMEWPPFKALLNKETLSRFPRQTIIINAFAGLEGLLAARRERLGQTGRSCWKVPGTFFWLRELSDYFPQLQYIHLIRHGLDMAYSGNKNQIRNWAGHLGVEIELGADGKARPGSMLDYWLAANEHAIEVGKKQLGERFLLVRFEKLRANPTEQLRDIFDFIGLGLSPQQVSSMAELVNTPSSSGRYRRQPWREDFTDDQLQRLESLGYMP